MVRTYSRRERSATFAIDLTDGFPVMPVATGYYAVRMHRTASSD